MGTNETVVSDLMAVKREVEALRERTQSLVQELEQRVHRTVDRAGETVARVRHALELPARMKERMMEQLRSRPTLFLAIGVGVVGASAVLTTLTVRRRLRARRPLARLRSRLQAYRGLLAAPQLGRPPRSLGRRLLGMLLVAAATSLTQQALQRSFKDAARPLSLPARGAVPIR